MILLSCFLLALGLFIPSCGKDDPTIIKGRVTDQKTGVPIEGVFVYLNMARPKRHSADEYFSQACGHTNSNGEFNCTLEGLCCMNTSKE